MRKFIALLLVLLVSVSSTFAQISYGTQKAHSQLSSASMEDATGDILQAIKMGTTGMLQVFFSSSSISTGTKLFASIAGVLVGSAILYPSVNGYTARSRDTSRISAMKNIHLALMTYNVNTESFPKVPQNGCLPKVLEGTYMKKLPTDPLKGRMNYGCIDSSKENSYAYRLVNLEENGKNSSYALISATMENASYGNSPYTIDEVARNPRLIKKIMDGELKGKYYIEIIDGY